MVTVVLILFALAVLFYILLKYLINQSKHPSGFIGRIMMKLWNRVYLPMTRWSLSLLSRNAYKTILDIGVGNGASTAYLHQLFPNSQIRGMDISEEAIAQAQQHYQQENVSFEVMDVSHLSYPSQSFDLICAFQTHFHWPDLKQALLEIKRVLANNGQLLLACEGSKLKYYLPELKDDAAFASYLESMGLCLMASNRKADWLSYQIGKKAMR
ncbi:class I SAM-dependent methyltransferase [Streptococcus mutans]|uniref:class I SAM-dependent methyltransferase n=1 Tax=Streptococcus mutans TaxID=1309 RepID=UPI001425D4EE|nr:class I SAM-dependent methyltransferase [Streptococcus mutans]QIQ93546.1 class I SAM-dependent methyltransferase [Streptococcus mutans]QIQ99789.1 class I SAM-dependent methyltransferase [Streptococcus mutans]QIR01436.1 class I SAM-dependent methyltransferase [Streptococcus mutans]QIR03567.1 class I SAM-dependent methyltransferase [Streptococcus mutans]